MYFLVLKRKRFIYKIIYIYVCHHLRPYYNAFWDYMQCCFRICLKWGILRGRIIMCKKPYECRRYLSFVTPACFIKQNVPTMSYVVPAWQLILQLITPLKSDCHSSPFLASQTISLHMNSLLESKDIILSCLGEWEIPRVW